MSESLFRVLSPGLMTTMQGLERPGWQRFGVAPGGAMDVVSLRYANALVRNESSARALEITLTGPTLMALTDAIVAVMGADLPVAVDGRVQTTATAFRVGAGMLLTFGRRRSGARAYLTVAAGIDVERHNGHLYASPIETVEEKGTGAPSRRLVRDDIIVRASDTPLGPPASGGRHDASVPGGLAYEATQPLPEAGMGALNTKANLKVQASLLRLAPSEIPSWDGVAVLRVIAGPQWNRFSAAGHRAFLNETYAATHESSRAGIRLHGPSIAFAEGHDADLISEPTPLGTVQVPAGGQPIVLMADRPTTGGYAKIATVISADISRAAQLAPGDPVQFRVVTLPEAHQASVDLETRLRLIERVATWGCASRGWPGMVRLQGWAGLYDGGRLSLPPATECLDMGWRRNGAIAYPSEERRYSV